MNNNDNGNDREIGEQIKDEALETENLPNSITRSIHIVTRFGVTVTVTSQAEDEDIDKLKEIAEELIDKYIKSDVYKE